jgi:aerobic carbon-monoxide dehydrogenase medium subunit
VAHADPASDLAAALLALDARVRLRSMVGSREMLADEFFVGPFTTGIAHQELVEEIIVPLPRVDAGTAYVAFDDAASGYPLAGAAAVVVGDRVVVGLTGVTDRPRRLEAASDEELAHAVAAIEPAVEPEKAIYRRQITLVVVRRAVAAARVRCNEGAA